MVRFTRLANLLKMLNLSRRSIATTVPLKRSTPTPSHTTFPKRSESRGSSDPISITYFSLDCLLVLSSSRSGCCRALRSLARMPTALGGRVWNSRTAQAGEVT